MRKEQIKIEKNYMEIELTEDANKVDPSKYTLLKFSETRNRYIFKKRKGYLQ